MNIKPIQTTIFTEGGNLADFVTRFIKKVPEESIIVVTSKIVALAEGRTAAAPTARAKKRLVESESDATLKTKYVFLAVKDGMIMANAGIDDSNANGKLVLLPKNSFTAAATIRKVLMRHYRVKNLGILITDSHTQPLRAGVTAVALGYAGFKGLRNYVGTPDLFGRKFKYSRTNVADSLATASALCMGEGAESQPLALITNAPVTYVSQVKTTELLIDPAEDMYAPLLKKLKKR